MDDAGGSLRSTPATHPSKLTHDLLFERVAHSRRIIYNHYLSLRLNLNKCIRHMTDLIPISVLLPGQVAEIRQIVGRPDQVRRLEELGVRNGTQVEMLRSGVPCIVRVGGTKLCFRDGETCCVIVKARMSA